MKILHIFFAIVTASSGQERCSKHEVPNLDGTWVCDDDWLIEIKKLTRASDDSTIWIFYFELPKFYAVSNIRTTSNCQVDERYLMHLSGSIWDERFDKGKHTVISETEESKWIPFEMPDVKFLQNNVKEYGGFAYRAPYWRLEMETVGMQRECLPSFMFFAKAGVAALSHFVMDITMNTSSRSDDSSVLSKAPLDNSCHKVTSVPSQVASYYRLDTSFYRKYTSAYGIPVMSSNVVDDRALQRACYVVRFLMADRKDIRDHMHRNKGRVAIIGRRQTVPMVPEMRIFPWFNRRAAGGTFQIPVNVGAEENMLCERGDGYARNQDIFMHEFAHGIHLIACHTAVPNFNSRLQRSFNSARRRGLWRNTYANTDNREYFAEGVQAYFNQQREGPVGGDGIQNHINTREELKRHDPTLYKIVDELFPCYNNYIPRCDDIGQLKGLRQNLKMNCRGGTGTTLPPTPTQPTDSGNCEDDSARCERWASKGECDKNPGYMLVNCKKSCKVCSVSASTTIDSSSTTKPIKPTTTNKKTTSPTTSIVVSTTSVSTLCVDVNSKCSYWAGRGECDKNPGYMKVKCRKSCEECSGGRKCTDSDANCPFWHSYCPYNQYVKTHCKKACNAC